MSEVTVFSLLFASVGILFVGLGVPLALGKVSPNTLYGCRTGRTLSDPKVWYEANRASGRDFITSGAFILAASLAALALGRGYDPGHVVIALISVVLLALGVTAWRCFRLGKGA